MTMYLIHLALIAAILLVITQISSNFNCVEFERSGHQEGKTFFGSLKQLLYWLAAMDRSVSMQYEQIAASRDKKCKCLSLISSGLKFKLEMKLKLSVKNSKISLEESLVLDLFDLFSKVSRLIEGSMLTIKLYDRSNIHCSMRSLKIMTGSNDD